MSLSETQRAIDATWRIEAPRLIAGLTRIVRDLSLAEELAMDALAVALTAWPETGVPRNPAAWLMQTAKRRAIDYFRRNKMAARKLDELGRDLAEEEQTPPDLDSALDDDIGDDLLRLIFTSCHPVLSPEARAALTLRLVAGLTVPEIAHAFFVPEPTIQQRIVRAKRTITEAHVPFEVPRGEDRAARVGSVLEVIYLVFNEGYAASSGETWVRSDLCDQALRLARTMASLMPDEAEVQGLAALLELQASRSAARTKADGSPILLFDQDRRRWDRILIRRGLTALNRAESLADKRGPYTLQAGIAACHARAARPADTDWARIAALYTALMEVTPSPVVELNRAVAFAFAFGPEAGLALVDPLAAEPALQGYHLLPSVRGDLLFKLGRMDEARTEFARAAELAGNAREKALLLERVAACG